MMNAVPDALRRLRARMVNRLYFAQAICRSRLSPLPKMKILFSDERPVWKPHIERGFRFTRHEISFAKLARDNIADFDVVVPLTLGDLEFLNEMRDLVVDAALPIPSMQCVRLCDDKYLLNQTLVANGFGDVVPRMGRAMKLAYPYILKKSTDECGKNSHVISGVQQQDDLSAMIADSGYFSQELITGRCEYATHVLFKNGAILCSINIEYCFSNERPIKGKDDPLYRKICRCPYLDVFSSILSSIGFEGLCCFNYKVREGRPFVLEINPRFGRSLSLFFFSFMRNLGRSNAHGSGRA